MSWKALIRFPVDIRRAQRILRDRPPIPSQLRGRPVALVLRTSQMLFDCGRHLMTIAHHCNEAGSQFYICCDAITLGAIARKPHGREMLSMAGITYVINASQLPSDAVVLTDLASSSSTGAANPTHQIIELQIGRDIDRSVPVMPYPMHPATLRYVEPERLASLRQQTRKFSVLFAGNQKPRYGDTKIQRGFGLINRLEILETVKTNFAARVVDRLASSSKVDDIVLSDSRIDPIKASDWLPSIASANFFLCCPGSSQPTCHHLVEAMSVGTIPLIEYGDRVTPELTDGVNAICFSGTQGLVNAINRIDRMTADEVQAMSGAAAQFYDEHLWVTRFISNLLGGKLDVTDGRICLPFHDRNFYQDRTAITRAA